MCVHIHVLVLSALPSVVRFPGRLKPNVVLLQRVETAGALAGTAGAGRDSPGLPAGIAAPRPGNRRRRKMLRAARAALPEEPAPSRGKSRAWHAVDPARTENEKGFIFRSWEIHDERKM